MVFLFPSAARPVTGSTVPTTCRHCRMFAAACLLVSAPVVQSEQWGGRWVAAVRLLAHMRAKLDRTLRRQ